MTNSNKMLKELREALPWGGVKAIAERLKVSTQTVRNVFDGKYENERVINEALELLKETRQADLELAERIKGALEE